MAAIIGGEQPAPDRTQRERQAIRDAARPDRHDPIVYTAAAAGVGNAHPHALPVAERGQPALGIRALDRRAHRVGVGPVQLPRQAAVARGEIDGLRRTVGRGRLRAAAVAAQLAVRRHAQGAESVLGRGGDLRRRVDFTQKGAVLCGQRRESGLDFRFLSIHKNSPSAALRRRTYGVHTTCNTDEMQRRRRRPIPLPRGCIRRCGERCGGKRPLPCGFAVCDSSVPPGATFIYSTIDAPCQVRRAKKARRVFCGGPLPVYGIPSIAAAALSAATDKRS